MSERIFGTDGVRGKANDKLTAKLALELGMAAGKWIHDHPDTDEKRPFVIVGRDPRLSGDMLEAALSAGLASMGVDVRLVDVIPTPGVSQLVISQGAAAGVVLSASHNPYQDNGIKFFGRDGKKLHDSIEDDISELLDNVANFTLPMDDDIGFVRFMPQLTEEYAALVKAALADFGEKPLGGLKLVMDCANGAASRLGPEIYRDLGAEVTVLSNTPNGVNINDNCGSTKTKAMRDKTRELGADAGIAFDGDADRVMLSDSAGNEVDGDQMMAMIALHLKRKGKLEGNTVVATIMSNLGLEKALEEADIRLHRTKVGDRYVSQAMEELGAVVGGEQSGHILLPSITPTGDGMATALQVLAIMHETGESLSELAGVVRKYPRKLVGLKVQNLKGWDKDAEIQAAIQRSEARFANPIWLSVRASGTEPLIRVMAQETSQQVVDEVIDELCEVLYRKLGKAE